MAKKSSGIQNNILKSTGEQFVITSHGSTVGRDSSSEENWNVNRPVQSVPWDNPKEIIAMCKNTYYSVGIIGNVIDIMTDFSVEGVTIQHQDKRSESFFKTWASIISLNKILHDIFLDLFRCGNVLVQKQLSTLNKQRQVELSNSIGIKFPSNKDNIVSRQIPHKYFTYDPTSIRVYGDEIVGDVAYYVTLDKNAMDAIRGYDKTRTKGTIDNDLLKKNNKTFEWEYGPLPNDRVKHLAWRKPSYSKYGFPFIARVLDEVVTRRTLFRCIRAAADGFLSAIRIWKLGQAGNGKETMFIPDVAAFNKLAKSIKSHEEGAMLDLIWNYAIDLQTEYAPVEKIFSHVPLDTIRKEIKDGLGIPDVLIDGSGGQFANSFLAIKTLIERLEYARDIVHNEWLMPELLNITEALGLKRPPRVKWGHTNLRDESTVLKLLLSLRDRKLLSNESLLEEFDYDKAIETSRILQEEKERKSEPDALKQYGPFFINDNTPNLSGGESPNNPNQNRGRPSGNKNKVTKVRNSQPQGINSKINSK